jgi:hypothetical protein
MKPMKSNNENEGDVSTILILCCVCSTMKTKPDKNSLLKFIIMKNMAAMNIDMTM